MTADLGSDFFCDGDLTPGLEVVTGRLCLAQALIRRLWGPLFYDPNYGFDLREMINSCADSTWEVESRIRDEFLKDERAESVQCSATFDSDANTLRVNCVIEDADGPFTLVVGADALKIEMLEFPEAA
ncbi:MAG: hypothetical protein ABFD89_17730 [Bryobacteraceae bacterium]